MNAMTSMRQLLASWVILMIPGALHGTPIFIDPENDTFGNGAFAPDIALLDSEVTATDVTFTVQFHHAISAPSAFASDSVVGFMDFDVDQDSTTGSISNQSKFSPGGSSDLGSEFYIDLFSEAFSEGWSTSWIPALSLP